MKEVQSQANKGIMDEQGILRVISAIGILFEEFPRGGDMTLKGISLAMKDKKVN